MANESFAEFVTAQLQEVQGRIVAEHGRLLELTGVQVQVAPGGPAQAEGPDCSSSDGPGGRDSRWRPCPVCTQPELLTHGTSSESLHGKDSTAGFILHSHWREEPEVPLSPKLRRTKSRMTFDLQGSCIPPGGGSEDSRAAPARLRCDGWVLHPNSKRRLVWDILGLVLICYDIVVLPLQAFELEPTPFLDSCGWITLVYWSMDLPGSFFVGYHTKSGVLVTAFPRIAIRYLFTWFPLDILIIAIDWALVFLVPSGGESSGTGSAGFARLGRTMRIMRILRLLRLMRLAKVPKYFMLIQEHIQSEDAVVVVRICKLTACVLVINHVVACCWFAIGNVSHTEPTWVTEFKFADADVVTQYTTSLHWSLTQFTPASMEVFPQNANERCFTLVVVVFALITFSSFVSSITSAMTHLCNMNSEYAKQSVQLNRYLRFHKISMRVAVRIRRHLARTIIKKQQRLEEDEVALLKLLSVPLLMDLRLEVYQPLLEHHPFFQRYCEANLVAMRKICYGAIAEVSLALGDLLFGPGETCDRMFFLRSGGLRYHIDSFQSGSGSRLTTGEEVQPCEWICEACLWTEWRHCGHMHASVGSLLVAVEAEKFHAVARKTLSPLMQVARYAELFVQHLNSLDPGELTDLHPPGFDVDYALQESCSDPCTELEAMDSRNWTQSVSSDDLELSVADPVSPTSATSCSAASTRVSAPAGDELAQ